MQLKFNRFTLLLVIYFLSLNLFSQVITNPQFVYGISTGGGFTEVRAIATDDSGNVYSTGRFYDHADFDPDTSRLIVFCHGYMDVFITKSTPAGKVVWAIGVGGPGIDMANDLKLDNSGNIYITGSLEGYADFDPGSGEFRIGPETSFYTGYPSSSFIAKFSNNGNLIWANWFGGGYTNTGLGYTPGSANGMALAADSTGDNIFATGNFSGIVDFNASATMDTLKGGNSSAYLLKLDSSGSFIWVKPLRGPNVYAEDLKLDPSGNVNLSLIINQTFDADPGTNVVTYTGPGIVCARYDQNGIFVSGARLIGASGSSMSSNKLSFTDDGDLYISGTFNYTADADPGAGVAGLNSNMYKEIFVCKYDSAFNLKWAKSVGGPNDDVALAVCSDSLENVFIGGYFSGTSDFDPGPAVQNMVSAGNLDAFILKLDSSGNFIYSGSVTHKNNDIAFAIAIDKDEDILFGGIIARTADLDPSPAVDSVYIDSNYGFIDKLDNDCNYIWGKAFGGDGGPDIAASIQVISNGDILIEGNIDGSADFDFSTVENIQGGIKRSHVYLARYSATASLVWVRTIESSMDASIFCYEGIADKYQNIYICGIFNDTVDFDPGPGVYNLVSAGGMQYNDCFVAKYNQNGDFLWARNFGVATNFGTAKAIALDSAGNVIVVGYFTGTYDFNPGPGIAPITATGTNNYFFSKFDSAGNFLWAKSIPVSCVLFDRGVACDLQNNIYLTGQMSGSGNIDFDPGPSTANIYLTGNHVFLAKYDASGNYIWANKIGGNSYSNTGTAIKFDQTGNVVLAGAVAGQTGDFDPGIGVKNLPVTNTGALFLAKYDTAGNYIWANAFEGAHISVMPTDLTVNTQGNITFSGYFQDTVDFDAGPLVKNEISSFVRNGFVASYDTSGNYLYSKVMYSPLPGGVSAHAEDNLGNIYLTGGVSGDTDFDPGPGIQILMAGGMNDAFIAKYLLCNGAANVIDPTALHICTTDSVVEFYVSTSDTGVAYQWQSSNGATFNNVQNNQIYSGVINDTLKVNVYNANLSNFKYRCVITNSCGSWQTNYALLTIHNPTVTISTSSNNVCSGQSVTLTASGASVYTWSDSVQNSVPFYPQNSDSFTVVGIDSYGCIDSNSAFITVYIPPVVTLDFSAFDTLCSDDGAFQLSGSNPSGGYFSGPGVVSNNFFDPQQAAIGINVINYLYIDSTNCWTWASDTVLVNTCLNLQTAGKDQELSVYPIPCKENLLISCMSTEYSTGSLSLFDISGRMLLEEKIELFAGEQTIKLNLANFTSGIYLIKIITPSFDKEIHVIKN